MTHNPPCLFLLALVPAIACAPPPISVDTAGEGSSGNDDLGSTGDSSTTDSTTTDATTTDSSTTDSTTTDSSDDGDMPYPGCPVDDVWEPNGLPEQAMDVPWGGVGPSQASRIVDDACLALAEHDWYRFDTQSLNYDIYQFYLRVTVNATAFCDCSDMYPEGPPYAVTVNVYRADTLELLDTNTRDVGYLSIHGYGDAYAHDLLVEITSPNPAAEYPYEFTVAIYNYDGEDECEC